MCLIQSIEGTFSEEQKLRFPKQKTVLKIATESLPEIPACCHAEHRFETATPTLT